MLFYVYNTAYSMLKMSEYEVHVHWLTDFALINRWAHLERIVTFLLKQYVLVIKK